MMRHIHLDQVTRVFPIGNHHQYTMFSFDPVKTITCIDGGAIVVNGEDAVKRLQAKRLIGMTQPAAQMYTNSRAWTYDMEELGFRYHMANLHAAIGVSQIKKLMRSEKPASEPVSVIAKNLRHLIGSTHQWVSLML